jgi:hypothetical protein
MTEDPERDVDVRNLHEVLDIEVSEAELSEDPSGAPDSQLEAYEARLRSLREAVVGMEQYEDRLGDA